MTGLRMATTKELLEELGRRPVENVKAELVAMPVPCMLLTCAEYEADLEKACVKSLKELEMAELATVLLTRPFDDVIKFMEAHDPPLKLMPVSLYEANIRDAMAKVANQYEAITETARKQAYDLGVANGAKDAMQTSGIDRFRDSIEIGTPSKGGAVKVYIDSANLDEARVRVNNALQARNHMAAQMNGGAPQ